MKKLALITKIFLFFDFYNKKIVDFLSFLVEVSLTLKHLYSILYSGDFSSPYNSVTSYL